MNITCYDYSFPLLPTPDAVQLVKMLGFDSIALGLWGAHTQLSARTLPDDPDAVGGLADLLGRSGLAVSDVFFIPDADYSVMAIDHPSPDERAAGRERFVKALEVARRLGSRGITLVPGVAYPDVDAAESLRTAAEELRARVDLGQAAGVQVTVEPHIGSITETPAQVLELLGLVPGLGITLDLSHFVMQGIAQSEVDIDELYARIGLVHARGARPGRLQVGMADNTIDFRAMVQRLKAVGYDGLIATEYLWVAQGGCDEDDTLSETILMRDLLRELIGA
jgi:Sugar phosphate isomerases/epimerases